MTSVPAAASPRDASAGGWRTARLHVVTGKGGTGKSTVAAAMAVALTRSGRRVLLAEVEGRQALAPIIGCSPLDDRERLVQEDPSGGRLHAVAVDAQASLAEYLKVHYRVAGAATVLDQVGAVEFATSVAPGLADLLVMGKLYEATRRTPGHPRRRGTPERYDVVVVDAPPTGRVVRFLDVSSQVADLARVGPIRDQADGVTRLVRSPETAVHVVTLLEEMPVTETVEAVRDLRSAGLHPGLLVVDQVRDDGLVEEDLADLDAVVAGRVPVDAVARVLQEAGLPGSPALAGRLVDLARAHAARLQVEGEQQDALDTLGLPTVLLPHLTEGVGPRSLRHLVQTLTAQVGDLV